MIDTTRWFVNMPVDKELLLSLAHRCEHLEVEYAQNGNIKQLEAEIDVAVYGGEIIREQTRFTGETYYARKYSSAMHTGGFGKTYIPGYLESIDAAMGLLRPTVTGCRPAIEMYNDVLWKTTIRTSGLGFTTGMSSTAAASLTAAALLARVTLFTQKNLDETPAIV